MGKGGRCTGLKPYHLHVPIVLKYGSLKLLETSGLVQVCNGIALRFYLYEKFARRNFKNLINKNYIIAILVNIKHCTYWCLMGNHTQPVSKKQKLPHKKQDVESTGLPRVEIKGSTRFP